MIEITSLRCNNCGGTLIHQNDTIWLCESCGKFSIVNVTADVPQNHPKCEQSTVQRIKFKLTIERGGNSKTITCTNGSSLKFSYKKRATMADLYPAIVHIEQNNGTILLLEDSPRYTYSKITINVDLISATFDCFNKNALSNSITCEFGKNIALNGVNLKVHF